MEITEILKSEELTLSAFKESLGASALNLSDDEIGHIKRLFEGIADATFDRWLERRNLCLLNKEKTLQLK